MFHYCAGIFIILFLRGLNSPSTTTFFRFPCIRLHSLYCVFLSEFSWKRSVFSTGILWPSNRALGQKTLDGGTGLTWKPWVVDSSVCFLSAFPNVLALQGRHGIPWSCSVQLFRQTNYISMCLFRQQWKQVGGLDRIVPLRLISFSTSSLQSTNSEQKARSEGDKAVIYKSTRVPAAKRRNAFPAMPPSNHLPHLLIICNQTWKDEFSHEPFFRWRKSDLSGAVYFTERKRLMSLQQQTFLPSVLLTY